MRAVITSIGESTTDLCQWSLERLGFEVQVYRDGSTLANKLKRIFTDLNEDFVRVDADVIVNRNTLDLINQTDALWYQSLTFDWFKQDVTHGGVQWIRQPVIPIVREHLDEIKDKERPESYLYRLPEFHNPRVCATFEKICGLTGYKQNDKQRVKDTKARRQQTGYDFELAERIEQL